MKCQLNFSCSSLLASCTAQRYMYRVSLGYITVWMTNSRVVCRDSDNDVVPRERLGFVSSSLIQRECRLVCSAGNTTGDPQIVPHPNRFCCFAFKYYFHVLSFRLIWLILWSKIGKINVNRTVDMSRRCMLLTTGLSNRSPVTVTFPCHFL